jgi:eukaryotic-like serine/threonine-protein kinase
VVVYEMLSGRPPFRADSLEALFYRIQCAQPVAITATRPEVPAALESVIGRLLEKQPAKRYPSAGAVLAALEEFPR